MSPTYSVPCLGKDMVGLERIVKNIADRTGVTTTAT